MTLLGASLRPFFTSHHQSLRLCCDQGAVVVETDGMPKDRMTRGLSMSISPDGSVRFCCSRFLPSNHMSAFTELYQVQITVYANAMIMYDYVQINAHDIHDHT